MRLKKPWILLELKKTLFLQLNCLSFSQRSTYCLRFSVIIAQHNTCFPDAFRAKVSQPGPANQCTTTMWVLPVVHIKHILHLKHCNGKAVKMKVYTSIIGVSLDAWPRLTHRPLLWAASTPTLRCQGFNIFRHLHNADDTFGKRVFTTGWRYDMKCELLAS